MKDSFFVDSNVILYLVDDINKEKREKSILLVTLFPSISPQVVFEVINVCLRKYKLDKFTTISFIHSLLSTTILQNENEEVVNSALVLYDKYSLQPYDAKIVASALSAGCKILYSEDMHNGLIIENRLTIINPFL